jgi:hypothetical protein
MLQNIIKYVNLVSYPNTHCVIGSAARTTVLKDYIPQIQQILPPFLDLTIPTRLIHFDPRFDSQIDFLHEYFKSKKMGFTYEIIQFSDSNKMHIWKSKNNIIEVICINREFHYPSRYDSNNGDILFFQELIKSVLQINSKLIVQDYSGNDTNLIFKKLYNQSSNKDAFKNNILFDFTYGHNHCDVDFEKYNPIVDSNGNFVNILLMNIDELMPILHISPIINEHINTYYIKMYREIVNVIPIDYRRKIKIESGEHTFGIVGYKNLYTIHNSLEEIIEILKKELKPIIDIFRQIGIMNSEKEALLNELLTNYRNYTLKSNPDVDWWSTQFYKIK